MVVYYFKDEKLEWYTYVRSESLYLQAEANDPYLLDGYNRSMIRDMLSEKTVE